MIQTDAPHWNAGGVGESASYGVYISRTKPQGILAFRQFVSFLYSSHFNAAFIGSSTHYDATAELFNTKPANERVAFFKIFTSLTHTQ